MLLKYYEYLPLDVEIDINNKLIHGKTTIVKRANRFFILDFLKYMSEVWNMKYLCPNYYGVKNYLSKGFKNYIFVPYIVYKKPQKNSKDNVIVFTGEDYPLYMNKLISYDSEAFVCPALEPKSIKKDKKYNKLFVINSMDNTLGYLTELIVSYLNLADKIIVYDPFSDLFFPKKEINELSVIYNYTVTDIDKYTYIVEKNKEFNDVMNTLNYSNILSVVTGDTASKAYQKYISSIVKYDLKDFMIYLTKKFPK